MTIVMNDGHQRLITWGGPPPEIITVCGSTRFKTEILNSVASLTLMGYLVISLGVFGHTDMPELDWTTRTSALKGKLDELHLRKIDMCDTVYVVNKDGYIGESTKREVAYAHSHGKHVVYLVPITDEQENALLGAYDGAPR